MRVGGADEAKADRVAAAITDWRDADDLRRPQGAEWQDHAAAGSRYRPRNGPFVALGELRAVAGMTPGLHAAVAPLMTLHSGSGGVDPTVAPQRVLLALTDADIVDASTGDEGGARALVAHAAAAALIADLTHDTYATRVTVGQFIGGADPPSHA